MASNIDESGDISQVNLRPRKPTNIPDMFRKNRRTIPRPKSKSDEGPTDKDPDNPSSQIHSASNSEFIFNLPRENAQKSKIGEFQGAQSSKSGGKMTFLLGEKPALQGRKMTPLKMKILI